MIEIRTAAFSGFGVWQSLPARPCCMPLRGCNSSPDSACLAYLHSTYAHPLHAVLVDLAHLKAGLLVVGSQCVGERWARDGMEAS